MKIAQRILTEMYKEDTKYEKLVAFLEKHRDCFDEINFFSSFNHNGAEPLSVVQQIAGILKLRIKDLKDRGFKNVGLNVLQTIGHIDEGYLRFGVPFTPIVGHTGEDARGCFCILDDKFRSFIREKYIAYAQANPDFIWVDDDIRFFNNSVRFGCFCPTCIERFNKKHGLNYTRENLVKAMEQADAIELRSLWVKDIEDKIYELFVLIREAVNVVKPDIQMGFMTIPQDWSSYNGMNFKRWMPILGNKGRPGEGFWNEDEPKAIVAKALSAARQIEEYPDSVTDVQYELEDFPNYSFFQKSRTVNTAECSLAIAQGMNGLLLNNLKWDSEYNEHETDEYYFYLSKVRKDWDRLEEFGRALHGYGLYPAYSIKYDAIRPLQDDQSYFLTGRDAGNHDVRKTYVLGHMGIPLTMDADHAYGAVFTGDLSDGYTTEELIGFLSKAVILDGPALKAFERRGLEKYLGVRCLSERDDDVIECYAEDEPMNKGFEGYERDLRIGFYHGRKACILEALDSDVRVLSHAKDTAGNHLGIATSLYKNSLGGQVCVVGCEAFYNTNAVCRQEQMRRVAESFADNKIQSRFVEPWLAQQFVRTDGKSTAVTIINLSIDCMQDIHFEIRNAKKVFLLQNGVHTELATEIIVSNYSRVKLPNLLPFTTCTLLAE